MTIPTTCPHGVDFYSGTGCSRCEFDRKRFKAADEAYKSVSHELNGGGEPSIFGAVLGYEHPYLLSKLVQSVAMAVTRRTYDRLCTEGGTIFKDEPHPEHDGRLSCGEVVGALRILGIARDERDVVKAVAYWRDRLYTPGY